MHIVIILLYICFKESLIGLHPDEEAAVIHALRQSLKATANTAAQKEVTWVVGIHW